MLKNKEGKRFQGGNVCSASPCTSGICQAGKGTPPGGALGMRGNNQRRMAWRALPGARAPNGRNLARKVRATVKEH